MSQHVSVTCDPRDGSAQPLGAVAIVASAGGIPALISLLSSLDDTFPLPIFVAQHLRLGPSGLDKVLGWNCRLNVTWAIHGAQPQKAHVYLVPPGMQLSVADAGFHVSRLAPSSSSWLASGDHLFKSVAVLYRARSIGIVLSGMMPAGVAGLRAMKACGGFSIAQDRTSSEYFDMPSAAIDFGKAEIIMSPERIADALKIIAQGWQEGNRSTVTEGRFSDAPEVGCGSLDKTARAVRSPRRGLLNYQQT